MRRRGHRDGADHIGFDDQSSRVSTSGGGETNSPSDTIPVASPLPCHQSGADHITIVDYDQSFVVRSRGTGDHVSRVQQDQPAYVAGAPTTDSRYDGTGPLGAVVTEIIYNYRLYRQYEKEAYRLGNKVFAICYWDAVEIRDLPLNSGERRKAASALQTRVEAYWEKGVELYDDDLRIAGVTKPYLDSARPFKAVVEQQQKKLEKLVRDGIPRPVRDFSASVRGCSDFALAKLIGEAGDIGEYRSAAGLRKRCGLAPRDGRAMSTYRKGELTADEWTEAGYSGRRLSVITVIAEKIAGSTLQPLRLPEGADIDAAPGLAGDQWRYVRRYLHRLRYEAERDPSHQRPTAKSGKESYSKHAHRMARRVMMQEFLRDLRGVCRGL